MNDRCAVIGGGMLGISLALRLARAGFNVTIHENGRELGGLAAAWEFGGVRWDRHYHVILPGDAELLRVIDDAGLSSELRWKRVRTAFYADGAMHPFTTPLDQLRFPVLSLGDKIRLARTVAKARSATDWGEMEAVTAQAWLRANGGDRVFERVWLPLLKAKLGDAYDRVSAAFIRATLERLYANGEMRSRGFGYVRGGYRVILDRLGAALAKAGVEIRLGDGVAAIDRVSGGVLRVTLASGAAERYQRVAVTAPMPRALNMCATLSDEERERIGRIAYQGIVCSSLLLDGPLGDAYLTNVADQRVGFTAVVEMSALVDPATFGGRHLVYLPRYTNASDPYFRNGDARIRCDAIRALKLMYPHFCESHVRAFRVSRVPHVFSLPTVGYSGRLPGFSTSEPGLYLATSAQIVNGTLNVNETLELAASAASHIVADPRFRGSALREAAG